MYYVFIYAFLLSAWWPDLLGSNTTPLYIDHHPWEQVQGELGGGQRLILSCRSWLEGRGGGEELLLRFEGLRATKTLVYGNFFRRNYCKKTRTAVLRVQIFFFFQFDHFPFQIPFQYISKRSTWNSGKMYQVG